INPKYILPGVGAFVCMLLSCCIKTCCFGKSSRKKDQPELEDADREPAAYEVPPPTEQLDPPTVPLWSHQDQDRFELKGIDTNNLLSSDSPHSDVYTSDKLNFL
ncbi:hypothetical protein GOODEAATRI_015088, partial [Goodea atripinnis]